MQGMLSQAQNPDAQPTPTGNPDPNNQSRPAAGAQGQAGGQDAYNVAAGQMLNFIYDQSGVDSLTGLMQAVPDSPEAAMGKLLGRLLTMTAQSAVLAGKHLAPDVLFQAGMEAARGLSEVAQSQGLLAKEQEQAVTEAAFFEGMTLFANEAQAEALTEEDRQTYVALLETLEQIEAKARGSKDQAPEGKA